MYEWVLILTKISLCGLYNKSGILCTNKSQYMTQLTTQLYDSTRYKWGDNDSDYMYPLQFHCSHQIFQITMAAATLNVLSHHNSNPFFIISIFVYMLISLVLDLHLSRVHRVYICIKTHGYLYLLLLFFFNSHTRKYRGVLDILIGIPYINYPRLHQEIFKRDSLNSFPPKVSRYFFIFFISCCRFEITTVPQIAL